MIRIHREGRLITALVLLFLLAIQVLSAIYLSSTLTTLVALGSLALLILVLRFFRVPKRRPFLDERTIVAPADGKVVVVEHTDEQELLHSPSIQISIFMSIHDVHINYFPVNGKVVHHQYHPGKYLVARHPKSSELNERFSTGIHSTFGTILVRQVAGYVARRIRNYTAMNRSARQGREMGFIKFGSRLDIFLPADARILVNVGERVTGGVSPVARFSIKDK